MCELNAGNFAGWMNSFRESLVKGGGMQVPCGECVACCASSLFIHIAPDEKETLESIPEELLFPAPGFPKGYLLMGYDSKGLCPMYDGKRCGIYNTRPSTCRQFDCRALAAVEYFSAGEVNEIIRQAKRWRFDYGDEESRTLREMVKRSADFLMEYRELFPKGFVPEDEIRFAVLVLKVYDLLYEAIEIKGEKSAGNLNSIIQAALKRFDR